ncbi:Cyclic di-GMP phosphodiesterase response regulator RpfG [Hartmannibacter diazotrophicus]|uniref:Cyclic di-GMP phosphodiesterase response regulator RpfG n=1 Tax=Hartmannibacter diazotrophicus TaxID=1482074 RepID=A0A2C9D9N1_9HYPH|nr:HD domain-containing phosphohydrolase [Hartmannibacter diazotrophicus]SON57022.1 Cyclic di-GMP phosphodiesterase response regulator RpfG [Hartmannibacter diazotrophicus]
MSLNTSKIDRITAILDTGPDPALMPIGRRIRTKVCDINNLDIPERSGGIYLIDIDLRDPRKVGRLREALYPRAADDVYIFAAGSRDHPSRVQAMNLGANHVINKPMDAVQIAKTLVSLCEMAPDGKSRPRGQRSPVLTTPTTGDRSPGSPYALAAEATAAAIPSVTAASEAIDDIFWAMQENFIPDMGLVTDASVTVLKALTTVPVDDWLTNVRIHHEGTYQHCLLATGVAAAFGKTGKIPVALRKQLAVAALLHDVGKSAVPRRILEKRNILTDGEMEIVRRHPVDGYEFLRKTTSIPDAILTAVRDHHELLDGSGYPAGRTAGDISPLTRVLTVCDIYAALTERRAYKPALPKETALKILHDMVERGKIDASALATLETSLKG